MGSRKSSYLKKSSSLGFFIIGFFCILSLLLTPSVMGKETFVPFDHSEWDQFLKKFVNEKGEVDYRGALKERNLLQAYLEKIKSIPTKTLKEWPREERLAIFINAYNTAVVKLILDHYPLKSMMDIPGVWDQPVVSIGTSSETSTPNFYSLNELQNEFLRRTFRDEKILFALSWGAKGSPPLRQEAYEGPRLEGQLYLVTRAFVNDEAENQITPGQKKIVLSRLFKWYGKDFLLNWGNFPEEEKWNPEEMAVLSFFAHYLENPKKVEFLREGKYKVKYEVFDWRLNDWLK